MKDDYEFQEVRVEKDLGLYYLTSVGVAAGEEDFRFAMTSHNVSRYYTASPKHAKRIMLMLKDRLDEYEKKYGVLKTELPKHKKIPSERKLGFKIEYPMSKLKKLE